MTVSICQNLQSSPGNNDVSIPQTSNKQTLNELKISIINLVFVNEK